MQRFISLIAMTACFTVLVAGLWQDWGLLTTLKRMVIAYLAFFIMGSLMALSVRFVALFEGTNQNSVATKEKSATSDQTTNG